MRILLAEDERYSRKALVQLLMRFDPSFQVDEAADGDEANVMLGDAHYELLICDIRMPGTDGLEVARRALENQRADSVVLLTGFAEFAYALEALRIGVRDYLLKPVDTDKLYAILEDIRNKQLTGFQDETVDKLIAYIRQNLGNKINIADVCRDQLFMHPAYVSRHYKKIAGETIISTIQRMRMERAYALLCQGGMSVSEIGEQCGYSDTSVFIQTFRKTYGMTPLEFRSASKNKDLRP